MKFWSIVYEHTININIICRPANSAASYGIQMCNLKIQGGDGFELVISRSVLSENQLKRAIVCTITWLILFTFKLIIFQFSRYKKYTWKFCVFYTSLVPSEVLENGRINNSVFHQAPPRRQLLRINGLKKLKNWTHFWLKRIFRPVCRK
jgi:hypothetical protein